MFLPRHDCDHTIITCQGTNESGHKHVWAQSCLGTNVCGHNRAWAQSCLGTNMCGHKRVWAQTCLGTIVSGHNRVWAQSCLGTIVTGHNRVGSCMYGHNRVVSNYNSLLTLYFILLMPGKWFHNQLTITQNFFHKELNEVTVHIEAQKSREKFEILTLIVAFIKKI